MSQENVLLVVKAFETAVKGDVEETRALFTPDHVFSSAFPAHLPFSGEAHGPDALAELMPRIVAPFERLEMETTDVVTQGDTVVLVVHEKIRAKATGKICTSTTLLISKVREGKVYSSRHYCDTYAISEILRPDEAPKGKQRPKKNAGHAGKNTLRTAKKKGSARSNKKTARARA